MKWRNVNPNPASVRGTITVLGPDHDITALVPVPEDTGHSPSAYKTRHQKKNLKHKKRRLYIFKMLLEKITLELISVF